MLYKLFVFLDHLDLNFSWFFFVSREVSFSKALTKETKAIRSRTQCYAKSSHTPLHWYSHNKLSSEKKHPIYCPIACLKLSFQTSIFYAKILLIAIVSLFTSPQSSKLLCQKKFQSCFPCTVDSSSLLTHWSNNINNMARFSTL